MAEDQAGLVQDKSAAPEQPYETYANTVRVEATVYDFALRFGVLSQGQEAEHVVVRMSPQHAKSVLILLQRFMSRYEADIGPVQLPEKMIAAMKGETPNDSAAEPS